MNTTATKRAFVVLTALLLVPPAALHAADAAKSVESDVCVYGGTSGGVAAAVQAARMGKSVVIAEPGRHLGGMTAGGLSAVDIGDPRSVGGVTREYFTKLAATVGTTLAWDKPFKSKGGGPATGGAYAIEPHKAEQLFNEMVREAGVKVRLEARLAAVKKDRARITQLVTEDGTVFRGKMFIDATYEGDLMAKAGVSYTLMREGNAKYGETYNGIYYDQKYRPRTGHLKPAENGRVPGGQGVWDRDFPLDPYVVKGDPKSGLLPLVQEGEPGTPGEPAPGVQAYCFRLCLTTDPANSIPIAPPPDYDPKRYEIVVRFIEACLANGDDMDLRWFSKHDPLPNRKWDFNTATFGGNLPVQQVDYAKLRARLLRDGQVLDGDTPKERLAGDPRAGLAAAVAVSPLAPKGTKPSPPQPLPPMRPTRATFSRWRRCRIAAAARRATNTTSRTRARSSRTSPAALRRATRSRAS